MALPEVASAAGVDWSISLRDILAFVTMLAGCFLAWGRLSSQAEANATEIKRVERGCQDEVGRLEGEAKSSDLRTLEAIGRVEVLRDRHSEFREHVAANYVTSAKLAETEDRIIVALNRLAERVDRALESRK